MPTLLGMRRPANPLTVPSSMGVTFRCLPVYLSFATSHRSTELTHYLPCICFVYTSAGGGNLNKRTQFCAAAAFCATGLLAWQGGLATLGWTEADVPNVAKTFLSTEASYLPGVYIIKATVKKQLLAMSASDRARLIQDLMRYAKSYASTPAFAKLYEQWIAQRYHAVNHGIKVDQASLSAAMAKPDAAQNMMAMMAAQMAKSFVQMPVDILKTMFPNDQKNWSQDSSKKQLAAKANQIAPLMSSNPEEFRKQYALLKCMEMGGPDTWAGVEAATAAGAKAQADNTKIQEQKAYDEHPMKAELRKHLEGFITLARSVDFGAQTELVGNKRIFVNRADERKSDSWKALYRLGQQPTMAAVAAAEAWLKEL